MRNIYTGIDIGSDSIKIVVGEIFNGKFHVLASSNAETNGAVKRGMIIDKEEVASSIKKAVANIESTIGLKVKEAIVTVPSNNRKLSVVSGEIDVLGDVVSGDDIENVLTEAVSDKVDDDYEVVSIIPITFNLDDSEGIANPKNKKAEKLGVKAVLLTVPKENITDVVDTCQIAGIEVKDICIPTVGDYFEARGKDTETEVGAVINIGNDTIEVSLFNKGIIIKDDIINLGSKNVDKDISYVYGVDLLTARELKENFSICSRKYADSNDIIEVNISDEEKIKINQYEISEVVEARVVELLKLAKKSINNLTNRKISYIIVTGGLSELTGFGYVVENTLGITASVVNISTMGVRNNKYSSAIGIIKYFHEKMQLKDINYSMFDDNDVDKILMYNKKNMLNINNDTFIGKLFGYFTNN